MDITQAKRIVVKVGTSTLTYPSGLINIRRIEQFVKVLADLENMGKEIVLVTSGAVGVGVGKLGLGEKPVDTRSRQAAAAVGQCELMYIYDRQFSRYNHVISQVLLTPDVTDDAHRSENCRNTLERLLEYHVIPVVNENDTVAIDEIAYGAHNTFGDNDTLSAIVAVLCSAELLVILSDIDGFYTDNPRTNPEARLISEIHTIDESVISAAHGAGSARGTGGMLTKVHAAQRAAEHGIDTVVMSGTQPERLYDLLDGVPVGTRFFAGK